MDLCYELGDCWQFTITLERIEPPGAAIKAPSIMEKHGKAPQHYGAWDE